MSKGQARRGHIESGYSFVSFICVLCVRRTEEEKERERAYEYASAAEQQEKETTSDKKKKELMREHSASSSAPFSRLKLAKHDCLPRVNVYK